ncbi:hypothetical protein BKA93DRAFT_727195 [Sparassis latifolia]
MFSAYPVLLALASLTPLASAHAAFFHPSMWGFNVTAQTFSYDNRPVVPLMNMPFDEWWFHGYKSYPPNPGDTFELPAGQAANAETACDKGLTSWWASSEGGNSGFPTDSPCLGQPTTEYHTLGIDDLGGCALSIAYNSDADAVQPTDFTIFSVNQTCVWYLNTAFEVPAGMPPCPDGGCICQWHWIHTPDAGSEQMYLIPFRCEVTGSTSNTPIGTQMLPRRCGADPANGRPDATPGNCTVGPKYPMYWDQAEGNNMFEGIYSPPLYKDLYGFTDGAQDDIFQNAYISSLGPGSGSGSGGAASTPAAAPTSTPAASPTSTPAASPTTTPAASPTSTPAAAPPISDTPAPSPDPSSTPAPSPVNSPDSSPSVAPSSSPVVPPAAVVQSSSAPAPVETPDVASSPSVTSSPPSSTPTVSLAPSSTQKWYVTRRRS